MVFLGFVIIDQTRHSACEKCLLDAAASADAAGSKLFEENFREIITKMSEAEDYNPFRLTKEEIASLDPNYKKPKKRKVNILPPTTETFFGRPNSSYNTNSFFSEKTPSIALLFYFYDFCDSLEGQFSL